MIKKLAFSIMLCIFLIGNMPYESYAAQEDQECLFGVANERGSRQSVWVDSTGQFITQKPIYACVNNRFLQTDIPVELVQGQAFIQMRPLFEALQAKMFWDEEQKAVQAEWRDKLIELKVDHPVAKVNGQNVSMSAPARMKDGHMLIPIRLVAEQWGISVI